MLERHGPILSSGSAGSGYGERSFASIDILFGIGREGLSLPLNTKYCNCRDKLSTQERLQFSPCSWDQAEPRDKVGPRADGST